MIGPLILRTATAVPLAQRRLRGCQRRDDPALARAARPVGRRASPVTRVSTRYAQASTTDPPSRNAPASSIVMNPTHAAVRVRAASRACAEPTSSVAASMTGRTASAFALGSARQASGTEREQQPECHRVRMGEGAELIREPAETGLGCRVRRGPQALAELLHRRIHDEADAARRGRRRACRATAHAPRPRPRRRASSAHRGRRAPGSRAPGAPWRCVTSVRPRASDPPPGSSMKGY